ncbi:MAG: efflux transporter outer membrane subunit [Deltaproteobacteria bacterium]|jgi:multidrug efflux system outer membrane protein|nr:efflux transporter outer membrane subunit [Deltaproteobacteria bacterium]
MMRRYFLISAVVMMLGGLVGCINLGPHYQRPDVNVQIPEFYQSDAVKSGGDAVMTDRWWHDFNDPELNRLVEAVLRYNWDLKQAAARILEARAQYVQISADRWPQFNFDYDWDQRRFGGVNVGRGRTITTHQVSFLALFEIDLWSRLAKASRASWNEILADEENRRTIAQTLVAETISLYLQIEAFERRLQIAAESIAAFERSLQFVETRYRRGLTSALDVRQARRILAGAQIRVPELQQQLGITQQQLSILLGRYPQTRPARLQPSDYYRQPQPVPTGLPSDLLRRRPDIRAAELRLQALNEQIGAAKADRFPKITLTGSYGWNADGKDRLFKSDSVIWNFARGVVHPLVDADRLKARQRGVEAQFQQAVSDYANTILNAFAEVEGALLTRQKQLERRQREVVFLDEARATQRVAQNRYIKGLVQYLDVLDAQQTRFTAEDNLAQVDLNILTNRVNLHRALGGSWAVPQPIKLQRDGYFFDFETRDTIVP